MLTAEMFLVGGRKDKPFSVVFVMEVSNPRHAVLLSGEF